MIWSKLFPLRKKQVHQRLKTMFWLSTRKVSSKKEKCKILVVGGGCGGCSLAAKLTKELEKDEVIVLEPETKHYYQPMFTLIGGGMKRLEQSVQLMSNILPKNAKWIKEKAVCFDPESNSVATSSGKIITYDILALAVGMHLNFNKVPGLAKALSNRGGKVCSIYCPEHVENTYEVLQRVKEGNVVFTLPATPIKCGGAPLKISFISEHFFRRRNIRDKVNIIYNSSLGVLFSVEYYANALWEVVKKRNMEVNLRRNLIEVCPKGDTAIFQNLDRPDEFFEEKYSMLHVVPPMSAPPELSECPDLVDEAGFVNVDKSTLQHLKFKNVFAIGDCSSLPTAKTAAAIASQLAVIYENIMAVLNNKELKAAYDGYSACPLITGYNSCIMAEFDYNLKPIETFPFSQNQELYFMFLIKKELLPILYWELMIRGKRIGPSELRAAVASLKKLNRK